MNNTERENKKYPKGHFVGIWMGVSMVVFACIGIAYSILTENFALIGVGPALGIPVGLSIGQSIENKLDKEGRIRPLTEEEQKRKKLAVIAGFGFLLVGLLALLLLFMVR